MKNLFSMLNARCLFFHPIVVVAALAGCAAPLAVLAADPPATSAVRKPSSNATINLINLMVERGLITRADADKLIAQSEAEADEAWAQAAATNLALSSAAEVQSAVKQLAHQQQPAIPMVNSSANLSTVPEGAPGPADDTVRVTYVPEIVKAQLREEIKQDVMQKARAENWAAPRTFPEWVTRFQLFGDTRIRVESFSYPEGNDNTGAFPIFNVINTGAPFDTAGTVFSPQYNADRSRIRTRLRARLGAAVDLGEDFSSGIRIATGENNSPVSQNQTFGGAGSGQGGNFSKYAVWLDRAFIKYEVGKPAEDNISINVGRIDNPFFATSLLWADDLGFDGAVLKGAASIEETLEPFLSVGAFPVFNTDLNFSSNRPAKQYSYDKWLYAAQLGTTVELSKDLSLKLGGAYYYFRNIEGRVSTPYTPINNQDAGDTDHTRPAFAQKGNTYLPLRDIVPDSTNGFGTANQWQYYGLATKFHEVAATGRLDFNYFQPMQVSLQGEWVKNLAFHRKRIDHQAVNNRDGEGIFEGGDTAWIGGLRVGHLVLQKRWDWNLGIAYRNVESDSVVDGFCDSDFGGGGTNVKGYSLTGAVALAGRVSLGLRWMSASEIIGPPLKIDILQFDLNAKY